MNNHLCTFSLKSLLNKSSQQPYLSNNCICSISLASIAHFVDVSRKTLSVTNWYTITEEYLLKICSMKTETQLLVKDYIRLGKMSECLSILTNVWTTFNKSVFKRDTPLKLIMLYSSFFCGPHMTPKKNKYSYFKNLFLIIFQLIF